MFRFHQDGAEAGDRILLVSLRRILPGILWKKKGGKLCQREVEVVFSSFVKDALGEGGRGFGSGSADGPEDDVQLG